MTLDLFHAEAVTDAEPVGLVTTGGTGSICHAMLAYREHGGQTRGVTAPQRHQARDRAPGVRQGLPPLRHRAARRAGRPGDHARSTSTGSPRNIDDQTVALIGSACNYGYGTIDPIDELADARRSSTASACTSTAASAASSCRSARSSATTSRCSTSASPASPPSRPTPTSTATPSRARRSCRSATRRCATRSTSSSPTGAAASTARPAWRARARAACSPPRGRRWCSSAARATAATPRQIFETVGRDAGGGALAPRAAASSASPTFLLQLHLRRVRHLPRQRLHADARLALQRPAVPERASTWPSPGRRPSPASPTTFATDLADAVAYAKEHAAEAPQSGAIYGGVAGGMTDEADEFIQMVMADMLDKPAGRASRSVDRPSRAATSATSGSSSRSTSAPAAPRSAWCRSPGAIAWHDHIPVDDPPPPRRRRGAGRRRVVGRSSSTPPAARWRRAWSTRPTSWR